MEANYEDPPEVICAVCKKNYGKGMGSPTQANDCAAHYNKGYVYGHYGSDFDLSKIRVAGVDLPERVDPVCDTCIRGWFELGHAVDAGEFNDFDQDVTGECQRCQSPMMTTRDRFKVPVKKDFHYSYEVICEQCFQAGRPNA